MATNLIDSRPLLPGTPETPRSRHPHLTAKHCHFTEKNSWIETASSPVTQLRTAADNIF
ncbi:hypothetical protein [Marinobacterium arenosum]|uniref:hypothetical protein n=1 Tax=Marinobacterium arenosum TaxID=2862496 RepID=UPI001C94C1B1|nr:hypothetical protein [Marinobacterium arenosum]MBY4677662.1 hypothetical protein [Marinobacterium arenosum]